MIPDAPAMILHGATVCRGRWRLAAPLYGSADESVWRASPEALITVGWASDRAAAEVQALLALPVHGVTPLLAVGRLDGHDRDALVEAIPPGTPSPLRTPDIATACRWGAAVAAIVAAAHAAGVVVGGLRPKAVWIDDGAVAALAPRATHFWELSAADIGIVWDHQSVILSPERIAGGGVSAADDLFALAVTVAIWATGQFPFAGDTRDAQVRGILFGNRIRFAGPTSLATLIAAALGPAGTRLSAADIGAGLDAIAHSITAADD